MTRDDVNMDLHLTGNIMTSLVYGDVIGVGTPDEITKVGSRYQMFIGYKGHGSRAVGVDFVQALYDTGVNTPRVDLLHDYTYMEQHWYFMTNYGAYTGYWASREHGLHSTII